MTKPQPSTDMIRDMQTVNRLVWVLNSHFEPYIEEFRGQVLTIPPNSEKIARSVYEGGNLMPFVAARRFLGNMKAPMDAKGVFKDMPKALRTADLNETEAKAIVGKTKEELAKDTLKEEKKAGRKLMKEMNEAMNIKKVAVGEDA